MLAVQKDASYPQGCQRTKGRQPYKRMPAIQKDSSHTKGRMPAIQKDASHTNTLQCHSSSTTLPSWDTRLRLRGMATELQVDLHGVSVCVV